MKLIRKAAMVTAAVMTVVLLSAGTANAQLRVGWGFLFPIPIPLPIFQIPHEPSPVTVGLLFPIPVPLPFYDYPYYTASATRPAARPVRERPMRYGQLMLKVQPESASVFINGKYYGRAGDFATRETSATVYPGQSKIEIKSQGYRTYVVYGDIKPGELVTIQYELQPEAPAPPK